MAHIHPAPHGGRPPDLPELPTGADPPPRWPAWYAPAGFLGGFAAALVTVSILGIFYVAAGGDVDDSGLLLALTLVQQAILCATAIFLASRTRRPKPWHFGLRRARLWPAVGWSLLGYGAFMFVAFLYSLLLSPDGQQNVTEDLGVNDSTTALVVAGILIIVVAPVVEEFFFRGFFYRALRARFGILAAAGIDGIVFGLIHYSGTDTLELIPVLALLGFVFCLIYERTGTLYTVIALHALNNSVAYGFEADNALVPVILGLLTITGCIAGPRLLHSRRTAAA